MLSNTLRSNFLKFYANRNHTPVTSSPVFPHNDPSILFTNAGMNQFKNIFLGKEQTSYTRATTSQKCIRAGGKHNDLENVGHTSRHLTFFEMLGNFSFGDYFKQDAISFAWEVSLSVFNFDPDFIYATVHEKDDEAFALWEKYLPTDKIFRLTDKDNFWSMADTGPCGFCSELLFDRGEKFGKAASPLEDVDGERFLEYWNLVFMEFNRASDGTLLALQKKCVDTGAGLERLVSLLAETETVFEADVLRHLIAKVENLSGTTYSPTESKGAAFRVIADHIRSLSFAIADGLLPGNTERGYVLRKILRRAVNYGKRLGFHRPFLAEVVPSLVETMGEAYPELQASETQIQEVLTTEEEHFFKTLQRGGNLLQQVLKSSASSAKISGEDAFKLKDTYGLPIDEIALLAKDHDYTVDMETFEKLEMEAKERSRKNTAKTTSDSNSIFLDLDPTNTSEFVGYHMLSCDTFIEGIVKYNEIATTLEEGEEGEIILRTTPFYAEKGGQIGDSGEIFCESGTFLVSHTTTPKAGLIVHHGKLSQGSLQTTMAVTAQVNQNLRKKIANNHTGCHLLHKALEITLGEHIRQAGSYVDSKKIRLDFTHNKALSPEDLLAIETIVNEKIRENDPVTIREALYSDVTSSSEIKQFFGDKYGDVVRVVSAGFSHELCGGTHAQATGDIGYFRITKEHAVATGIRRIEAITGEDAETLARGQDADLNEIASVIQSPKDQILVKIRNVIEEKRELAKQVADLENQLVQQHVKSLLPACDKIDETLYLGYLLTEEEGQRIQQYANALHKEIPANFISLWVTEKSGRYIVLIRVSDDLIKRGIHAQVLLEELLAPYGGRCGGKAISAQGSSKELPPIEVLNKTLRQWISTRLV
ncbi:alanine--tRNA ligase [Chlamydia trachomatis]|uniref:Alanine--tRNA ligase n=1 Tax=Chlamydia suis TaxID=83559 RepID=A0ABX6IPM4_9CHLA|nr:MULTISPECIES: alanine--tRNA ligase [Chlamydia]AGR96076.1 alanyl-tRNA synthetase [Chlamydia trachomatis RC-F(s)/852]AGR99792.1 alanyl-tRNA synthetase [Chlamydia trachomatis RC-F(s)/342]AGS00728.1 alanyl-tRNA synthetase [Chlamydia trachomatis RC-J(s)/122]AGS02610.1 alanyl-tRNA synthetase [Chlamydia trachomatis J/6276tet1]QHP83024.1 Alanyl-tRNA synthetase [Chlamydia suis]